MKDIIQKAVEGEPGIYKSTDEINKSIDAIDSIMEDIKDSDPEFYESLKELFTDNNYLERFQ